MKKILIIAIFSVANLNAKHDKTWDALNAKERQEYINIKQQLGSYVAACGGNATEEQLVQYLKKIGTSIAKNFLHNCTKIRSILDDAEKLSDSGKGKEALVKIDSAIAVDRTYGNAWAARGDVNFSLGNYVQCISDYSTAISIFSPIPPYTGILYTQRALAYQSMGNMNGFKSDILMAASFGNAEAQQVKIAQGW